jgi:hypothetical protein
MFCWRAIRIRPSPRPFLWIKIKWGADLWRDFGELDLDLYSYLFNTAVVEFCEKRTRYHFHASSFPQQCTREGGSQVALFLFLKIKNRNEAMNSPVELEGRCDVFFTHFQQHESLLCLAQRSRSGLSREGGCSVVPPLATAMWRWMEITCNEFSHSTPV